MTKLVCVFLPILICCSALSLPYLPSNTKAESDSLSTFYSNPVFVPTLADPSIVFDSLAQTFYAYGTADNWADGQGTRYVPVLESVNLVDWKYVGSAFDVTSKPSWKNGGIWAPDVVKVNGNYHLYYAISVWDDPDASIGVAVSNSPKGPFIDHGKLFSSKEIDVPNSIDPFYIEDGGKKYLFWGSFSSLPTQGTYGIELADDGLHIAPGKTKFKIAAGDWEAVVIHKKDDYYYMFGSKGSCCNGADSKYHVLVGRSKLLEGPYLDKNSEDIAQRDKGTLILTGNDAIVGPGHTSRIMTDHNGNDWILYHGIIPSEPYLANGVNRRVLLVDQLHWQDGWPIINDGSPNTNSILKPIFN